MIIERFKPEDLDEIELQPAQESYRANGTPEFALLLASELAYTVRAEGKILACAGVRSVSRDVGELWSALSIHAGRRFLALHRAAKRLMQISGKARLVALADHDFPAGCRWLGLLGFECVDPPMPFPDGTMKLVYVRANE